jgi:hypothetical protein
MPRTAAGLRALVASFMVSLAFTASSATAAEPGVISDLNWGLTSAQQQTEVSRLTELRVRWIRLNLEWAAVETARGSYSATELANMDRSIDLARSTGARVMLVVFRAPAWASGSTTKTTPNDPADFARFMRFLAERYAGRVSAYEIWNEQDLPRFWTGGPNPLAYTALLKAAYPAVKAADPAARVVFGGLDYTWYGINFLGEAYAAGAKGYFDAMGVHAYTLCGTRDPMETKVYPDGTVMEGSFARYRNLRKTMLANGDDKPIWITEFGWNTSSATCDRSAGVYYGGVSESTQADFLTKAYKLLEGDPYVEVALWYMSRNWASDADTPNTRYGLMSNSFVPKPAFSAFKAYATPTQATPGGTVSISGSTLVYTAAPGRTNDVTVALASGTYTVQDSAAGVNSGSGCAAAGAGVVTCPATGVRSITADGGDGNDRLVVTAGTPATLNGGPGDDVLAGGPKADVLQGGAGADAMGGGGGADQVSYAGRTAGVVVDIDDVADDGGPEDASGGARDNVKSDVENLNGGAGADSLTGSPAANVLAGGKGPDVLSGLGGIDTANYAGRTTSLTVTLDGLANDGGSEDVVSSVRENVKPDVENITGGSGADALTGSSAANRLVGGGGLDTVAGLDGADTVHVKGDRVADVVTCGSGADTLTADLALDQFPTFGPDACETVS